MNFSLFGNVGREIHKQENHINLKCKSNKETKDSRLFKKLHNVSVKSRAHNFEALKSGGLSQGFEILFGHLSPTCSRSQHDAVKLDHMFGSKACVWEYWENTVSNNHFPIFWKCFVAILQDLHAGFFTPIMTYPL